MARKKAAKRKKKKAKYASEPRTRKRSDEAVDRRNAFDEYLALHSNVKGKSRFDPTLRFRKDGSQKVTYAEYVEAYRKAWVQGDQRWGAVRKKGSPALRFYLVNVTGLMTSQEYADAYSDVS
jgi:hypothetical protein